MTMTSPSQLQLLLLTFFLMVSDFFLSFGIQFRHFFLESLAQSKNERPTASYLSHGFTFESQDRVRVHFGLSIVNTELAE